MDFSIILRNLRQKNFFSQQELADKLHISRSNIANYETGKNLPSLDILKKIANIFNVSTDYLLGNTNIQNPKDILEEKLAAIHLSSNEFDEAFNDVLKYYSGDSIVTPISNNQFSSEKVKNAFSAIQFVAASFFGNKIDAELGETFDFTLPHTDEEQQKLLKIQTETRDKITEIIDSMDLAKIIIPNIKHLSLYNIQNDKLINSGEVNYSNCELEYTHNYFACQCQDESMSPALGIGDIAIIEETNILQDDGKVYLISLDDKQMIRIIKDYKNYIELQALNYHFESIKLTKEEMEKRKFKIIGKVVKAENESFFK